MAPKKTAMTKRPGGLQRLSPGVYRSQTGALTNSAGQSLRGGPRPPQFQAMPGAAAGQAASIAQGTAQGLSPEQLPAGISQGLYEPMPGNMAAGLGVGIGATLGGQKPSGEPFTRFIQPFPGPQYGGTGIVAESPNQYAGYQRNNLEDMARQRAEAINRGDMVTMDYNPQREALVGQYLDQMRGGQSLQQPSAPFEGYNPANQPMVNQPAGYAGSLAEQLAKYQQGAAASAMGGMTQGVAQGVAQGLGGQAPMQRPSAPMRPRGDGRDRRFAQAPIATRPPAPLPANVPAGPIPRPMGKGAAQLLRRGR